MRIPLLSPILIGLLLAILVTPGKGGDRLTLNFNPDWRFTKSDPAGASARDFDDGGWDRVSTPHTYNDTDTFDHWSTPGHRGEQLQWSGRTWYRKHFVVPESWRDKLVIIEFQGARQIAEIYLNGHLLGVSKTGFTPFGFDLTDYLVVGRPNVLAVMCDNRFAKDPMEVRQTGKTSKMPNLAQLSEQFNEAIPDSLAELTAEEIPWNNPHWHPAHGGLYRDVRLIVADRLHITLPLYSFLETVGPYAYATKITDRSAQVGIEIPVQNSRSTAETVEVSSEIIDADGKTAFMLRQEKSLAAGARAVLTLGGQVDHPRLWEPDYPHVYTVWCILRVKGEVVDRMEIPLGIRKARWDAAHGFFINGRPLKLHGWGQKPTDEWPGLGAAQPDWLHAYTLRLMRDAGGNFVRWGHCAAGMPQIEAGDRLGIIADQPGVDGESDTVRAAWELRAQAFRDVVIYFRNNPSILIWEGGNQEVTHDHAKELRGLMDRYDPHGGRVYAHRRADEVTAEFMDIGIGTEGGREIARLPVVEGEYDREESPRRVWDDASPPNFGYLEAKGQTYQLTSEQFAVNQVAQYVKKLGAPWHCGGANWIFSDTTSGGRVSVEVARASGKVDGVRLPKEAYYVCAAMFRDDPQVHIIGHWSYPSGTVKTVYAASNAEDVELFLNGRSIGHGIRSDRYLFTFPGISFQPGELKALASSGGKVTASEILRTAGEPAALRMTSITGPSGFLADGSDVALIDVEAVDGAGERCPTFQKRVDFTVEGPATWRGGYNSGKVNSINQPYLDLECGINRVAIRSTREAGSVTVTAHCGSFVQTLRLQTQPLIASGPLGFPLPAVFPANLPMVRPQHPGLPTEPSALAVPRLGPASSRVGRYIKAFSYSGPSYDLVRVDTGASVGDRAYVDVAITFPPLPTALSGSDWIRAAQNESLYHAVDLMQIEVPAGTTVSIAHDDRLPRPPWLLRMFAVSPIHLSLNGSPMTVFQRHVSKDESLTLGPNTEDPTARPANMYVVFVNGTQPNQP